MGNSYEEFSDRYNSQWEAVFRVAAWLHSLGDRDVTIHKRQLRKKDEKPEDYFDAGDITVTKDGVKKVIEVKHDQKNDFTTVDNFPYKTVVVIGQGSFDRNANHVAAYIRVNKSLTHALIMSTEHKNDWILEKKWMTNTEQYEGAYFCPKKFISSYRIG